MNKDELDDLLSKLLKVTEDGPITQWTERIAQLVKTAGLPVDRMDWSGSARTVAFKVADYVSKYGEPGIQQLKDEIEKRSNSV